MGQRNTATPVIVAGALILSAAMGIRQTFGLFVDPIALDRGLSLSTIAVAIALHNLVWGFAQPFAGAAADRYGAAPVVGFGALAFAAGLTLAANASTGFLLVIGMGLLVGIGVSCTTFAVILTSVGRVATPERRSMAMGLASAGGSFGQFALVPATQLLSEASGLSVALLALAVLMVAVSPLGLVLDRRRGVPASGPPPLAYSLSDVLALACRHRGYILLTLGFFTCGFQLAFITVHLPAYLKDAGLSAEVGGWTLAVIGLANAFGSLTSGWLSTRMSKRWLLAWIYFGRSIAIAAFIMLPASPVTSIAFGISIGLLWLSTVPPTSSLVMLMFGTRYMAMLYGFAFFSHQVGGFLGVWLGGIFYEAYGNYTLVWWLSIALGIASALINLPIKEVPVERAPALQPAE
jgi:predicted MFS family arabinose efflux permease